MLSLCRRSYAVASISRSFLPAVKPLPLVGVPRRRFAGSATGNGHGKEQDEDNLQSHEESVPEPEQAEVSTDEAKALDDLQKADATVKELHHKLLLKYADAENKRRERSAELKRRDAVNIKLFADKTYGIYESLESVCKIATEKAADPTADEKVKSFAEGLSMTRGIMRNILAKHNVVSNK